MSWHKEPLLSLHEDAHQLVAEALPWLGAYITYTHDIITLQCFSQNRSLDAGMSAVVQTVSKPSLKVLGHLEGIFPHRVSTFNQLCKESMYLVGEVDTLILESGCRRS